MRLLAIGFLFFKQSFDDLTKYFKKQRGRENWTFIQTHGHRSTGVKKLKDCLIPERQSKPGRKTKGTIKDREANNNKTEQQLTQELTWY